MTRALVTAPTSYPISLSEAKDHLRMSGDTDVFYITDLIPAATEYVEDLCSNKFVEQTWRLYLDEFPNETSITLPFGKVVSVTSVKYTNSDGDDTTWDSGDYTVDTVSSPGKIDLAYNETWPDVTLQPVNGIVIEFVTGYSKVPYKIKQAIKIYLSHLYENREPVVVSEFGSVSIGVVPLSINALVADYRMGGF